jgi:hypothetical protein
VLANADGTLNIVEASVSAFGRCHISSSIVTKGGNRLLRRLGPGELWFGERRELNLLDSRRAGRVLTNSL